MKKPLDKMTVAQLEVEVRRHNRLYFAKHSPEISDYDFDRLVGELIKRRPDSKALAEIGSDSSQFGAKVRHEIPMLSLDKCYDDKTLADWAAKFKGDIIASPKIDGCAVSLKYGLDGGLMAAATRGDGIEGELITVNARMIKAIPQRLVLKNVEVRGEVYMPLSVFARYKGEFANPRNLTAGAIKQKDPKKTGEYALAFWAYDLLGSKARTEAEKRELLAREKFPVAEWVSVDHKDMKIAFERFLNKRLDYDFETDGVVYKADAVAEQERLGLTAHHPRFAIAYKYQGESGETVLVDVEWSVARTGVITPVAVVEPVELSGVTVTRASLHNVGCMRKLGISKGARILMMRRGGVIPNVESVVKKGGKPVEIPCTCPSCGADVKLEDDFLYCSNPKRCVASKIAELEHFIKEISCDGFGEKLITQLYEYGLVTDPSEFYTLTKEDMLGLERMGEVLANKLIVTIGDRRELTLEVFLRSLGLREVGRHVSKLLGKYGDIKKVMALTEDELSNIHTIGPVIAHEVVEGLKEKRALIEKLLKHVRIAKGAAVAGGGALAGKKVLFTGSLVAMERKAAQEFVEKHGGEPVGGVSKELDYLVVGSGGGGAGSKLKKVKKLIAGGAKTKILSEEEFIKLVS